MKGPEEYRGKPEADQPENHLRPRDVHPVPVWLRIGMAMAA